jgi:hypothetical protein
MRPCIPRSRANSANKCQMPRPMRLPPDPKMRRTILLLGVVGALAALLLYRLVLEYLI